MYQSAERTSAGIIKSKMNKGILCVIIGLHIVIVLGWRRDYVNDKDKTIVSEIHF